MAVSSGCACTSLRCCLRSLIKRKQLEVMCKRSALPCTHCSWRLPPHQAIRLRTVCVCRAVVGAADTWLQGARSSVRYLNASARGARNLDGASMCDPQAVNTAGYVPSATTTLCCRLKKACPNATFQVSTQRSVSTHKVLH